MSEPIFRAFNNKTKEWIRSFNLFIDANGLIYEHKREKFDCLNFLDDAVLCRSTGLKDNHGKMIFEFDIIKSSTPNFTIIRRVEYSNESASFVLYKIPFDKRFMHNEPMKQDWLLDYSSEIIGSSLENPELLEQKQ